MDMYRDPTLAAVMAKEGGEIARELACRAGAAGRSADRCCAAPWA